MAEIEKAMKLRQKQWEGLCAKYEIRGRIHTDSCFLYEVNYKMFMERKSHKANIKALKRQHKKNHMCKVDSGYETVDSGIEVGYKDGTGIEEISAGSNIEPFTTVDITKFKDNDKMDTKTKHWPLSELNDDNTNIDVDSGDKDICIKTPHLPSKLNHHRDHSSVTTKKYLKELIDFIEQELKSNLKTKILNRRISQLLDTNDYDYWHKSIKQEMMRLEGNISRSDLKMYLSHCFKGNAPEHSVELIDRKVDSDLKKLLMKREFARGNQNHYLKCCQHLHFEWNRLEKHIPVDQLLLYAEHILHSVRGSVVSSDERLQYEKVTSVNF